MDYLPRIRRAEKQRTREAITAIALIACAVIGAGLALTILSGIRAEGVNACLSAGYSPAYCNL